MTSTINKLPITLLAQLDEVAVFQTAAFISDDNVDATAANLQNQLQTDQLEFELPSGAFATSVLRELCHFRVSRPATGLSTDD